MDFFIKGCFSEGSEESGAFPKTEVLQKNCPPWSLTFWKIRRNFPRTTRVRHADEEREEVHRLAGVAREQRLFERC